MVAKMFKGGILVYLVSMVLFRLASCNVKNWAALGDSFASGIGAGDRENLNPGDRTCSRYTQAYANVMNVVIDNYEPITRNLSWPACSGADTDYVIANEVPAISPESDIVTLTIGGNNVGFGDCANACIFKVNRFPDCGTTLANTGDLINNVLPGQLDAALDAIMTRVISPGFKLYFTSYPHFWNVDTTACNDVSFNFWADTTPNYLTQALRTQMNGLTESLNAQISAAAGRANARDKRKPVVYVDVSPAYNTHRYCDIGIEEPDPDSSNPNEQRWFQENWLFDNGDTWSGDSMAIQWQTWATNELALDPSLTVSSGWANVLGSDNLNTASNTWVFDSLNRAFHPTIDGQDGIKNVLLSAYTATPPSTGAYALQTETSLERRTAMVERANLPEVTQVPKPRRFTA